MKIYGTIKQKGLKGIKCSCGCGKRLDKDNWNRVELKSVLGYGSKFDEVDQQREFQFCEESYEKILDLFGLHHGDGDIVRI